MNHRQDARAEELQHLKLALATFALQLDAFEMQTQSMLLPFGKPGNYGPPAVKAWLASEGYGIGGQ